MPKGLCGPAIPQRKGLHMKDIGFLKAWSWSCCFPTDSIREDLKYRGCLEISSTVCVERQGNRIVDNLLQNQTKSYVQARVTVSHKEMVESLRVEENRSKILRERETLKLPWYHFLYCSFSEILTISLGYPYDVKWSESVGRSVVSVSLLPHGLQPTRFLCPWPSPGKNTGMGSHSLLQGIFPAQRSNPGLHCKQILSHLSHQGSSPPTICCPLTELAWLVLILVSLQPKKGTVHRSVGLEEDSD